jgi:Fe-S-cluster containining protein
MNSPKETWDEDVCAGCGRCCEELCDKVTMYIAPEDLDDIIRYYKGLRMKLYRYKGDQYYGLLVRKCTHLDPKTKKCTIYENRPKPCREYPYQYIPHHVKWCPLMKKMRDDGRL